MVSPYVYLLVEKDYPVRGFDAGSLVAYVRNGYSVYDTAEEAEEGRRRYDAYEEPGKTRVVGVKVKAFLPKKSAGGRRKGRTNETERS